jgi:hypothetical protein
MKGISSDFKQNKSFFFALLVVEYELEKQQQMQCNESFRRNRLEIKLIILCAAMNTSICPFMLWSYFGCLASVGGRIKNRV